MLSYLASDVVSFFFPFSTPSLNPPPNSHFGIFFGMSFTYLSLLEKVWLNCIGLIYDLEQGEHIP